MAVEIYTFNEIEVSYTYVSHDGDGVLEHRGYKLAVPSARRLHDALLRMHHSATGVELRAPVPLSVRGPAGYRASGTIGPDIFEFS